VCKSTRGNILQILIIENEFLHVLQHFYGFKLGLKKNNLHKVNIEEIGQILIRAAHKKKKGRQFDMPDFD
jgi:hypothetical protein